MPRENLATRAEYAQLYGELLGRLGRSGRQALLEETRQRVKVDLHAFAALVMGCWVMSPRSGLHGRVCSFLEDQGPWPVEKHPRKWLELFRGALKSTLGTIGWSLQAVVRNPEERVLLVSATHPLARSFLREIKKHIEGQAFRVLFPHLRPDKACWNQDEAALLVNGQRRRAREPNFGTAGLDVGVTGTHWSRIVYDDLVVPENVGSRAAAQAVIRKFALLRPLLDTWGTPELVVGTPYEPWDFYAWLKRRPKWFTRLSVPLVAEDGQCAWPEEFPPARVAELRRLDQRVFMSQYMLNPRPEGAGLVTAEQLQYWARPGERGVAEWQTSTGRQIERAVDPRRLTYYLGYDPATGVAGGDAAAFVVVGIGEDRNLYVCEALAGNWAPGEQLEVLFTLAARYAEWGGLQRVVVEQAGGFAMLAALLEDEMAARNQFLWVEKAELSQSKETRVRLILSPLYMQGRLYHHWSLGGSPLEAELQAFPAASDDLVDALTYACSAALRYGAVGAPQGEAQRQQLLWSGFGEYPTTAYTMEQLERMTISDMIEAGKRYRELILGAEEWL